jgi:hypothetical protein
MRILHGIFAVFVSAVILTLIRDPAGRVAVVVFVTEVAELICGLTAIMMLFRTFGAIGQAQGPAELGVGVLATAAVLAVASVLMAGMVAVGVLLVLAVV